MSRLNLAICLLLATLPVMAAAQETTAPAEQQAQTTTAEPAAAGGTTASVLDGVFTEEQATAGQAVYRPRCTTCHGGDLRGTPGGPSLLGISFNRSWVGTTVADLYTFIHDNMPAGRGGSLTDQQYIDVTAFILSRAKYPAGDTELVPDPAVLGTISIVEAP